jgi:hypothetical protein
VHRYLAEPAFDQDCFVPGIASANRFWDRRDNLSKPAGSVASLAMHRETHRRAFESEMIQLNGHHCPALWRAKSRSSDPTPIAQRSP